ncbi:MAG: tetratricopeptide repeat protein [Rubricoccaceae bacterium]
MSETSPPPSEAVIQTAARLLAAGRASEAADRLHQLVEEAPTYAAAHVLLASALDASGRTTEALEIWRRAAFLVPQSPLVHRERQRLVDAHRAAPEEASEEPEEIPIEAWDEDTPAQPEDPSEDELPAREETSPTLELATEPDALHNLTSSTQEDAISEPEAVEVEDSAEASLASSTHEAPEQEFHEARVEDAPPTPETVAAVEEPLEMPLLPPEGDVRSTPRPARTDLELEDDGWTLLEDDIAPLSADAPRAAPLLPPEPEPAPPPAPPDPEPTPEPEPVTPDSSIADDLDDLITQLDSAPRIKPDPTFSGPKVTFDESSMDDMVSETLAKIYAAQHQYVEAAVVYEKLAAREPDHADTHLERAAEMRDKAS